MRSSQPGNILPSDGNSSCYSCLGADTAALFVMRRREAPLLDHLKWKNLYWFPALGISPSGLLSQRSVKTATPNWVVESTQHRLGRLSDLVRNLSCDPVCLPPTLSQLLLSCE